MRLRGNEGEDFKTRYLEKIEDARLGDGHGCWVTSTIAMILIKSKVEVRHRIGIAGLARRLLV